MWYLEKVLRENGICIVYKKMNKFSLGSENNKKGLGHLLIIRQKYRKKTPAGSGVRLREKIRKKNDFSISQTEKEFWFYRSSE